MLNIAFASRDAQLAEEIKKDLMSSGLKLVHDYLLVLVSGATAGDAGVMQSVQDATQKNQRVIPVLVERVPLPPELGNREPIDFSHGYRKDRLVYHLRWVEIGKQTIAVNRRLLAFWVVIAVVMFFIAWIGIAGGLVAFPQGEYETESAIENATIDAMLFPTLEGYMPRTTEDARYFPQTLEAAPNRMQIFMGQTATALPRDVQATLSANETAAAQTITAQAAGTTNPSLTVTATPDE
jgi:hypothetical protein